LAEARFALEIDPLSLDTNFGFGWFLVFLGDYDGAERQARATLDLYPDSTQAHYVAGYAHLCRHRVPDAIAAFERAASPFRDVYALACLAYSFGRAGRTAEAAGILEELSARRAQAYVPDYAFFMVYSGLGDRQRAFEALERCAAARDSQLFWVGLMPDFELLCPDPRFQALIRRLGLRSEP
jgi:tetratricopeptide (TPR) repeat protein